MRSCVQIEVTTNVSADATNSVLGARYSCSPATERASSWPVGGVVFPGIEPDQLHPCLREFVPAVDHRHDRFGQWCWIDDVEEQVDVDMLDGEAAADDVVARLHQLDARTSQVAVQVPCGEVEGFARQQRDVIEEQGHSHAWIAGIHGVQPLDPPRFGAIA